MISLNEFGEGVWFFCINRHFRACTCSLLHIRHYIRGNARTQMKSVNYEFMPKGLSHTHLQLTKHILLLLKCKQNSSTHQTPDPYLKWNYFEFIIHQLVQWIAVTWSHLYLFNISKNLEIHMSLVLVLYWCSNETSFITILHKETCDTDIAIFSKSKISTGS